MTIITYKNVKVQHRETNQCPLMIGTTLLHHDSNFQTYHSFFSHVKSITNHDITGTILQPDIEMQLGSDDEKTLVAAMDSVFPNSIRFLCTRHLKENVVRFLTKKVGVPQVDLKVVKSVIFGKEGLAHADSFFVYEERVEEFKRCIEMQKYPLFQKYFDERLNDHILNHVVSPNVIRGSNDLWTNNISDSMSNAKFNQYHERLHRK